MTHVLIASSAPHKMLESPSRLLPDLHLPLLGYSLLLIISIGICLVGVLSIIESKTRVSLSKDRFTLSYAGVAFISFSLTALVCMSILLRLGTLRLKKIPSLLQPSHSVQLTQSEILYNHREMDELIFEVFHSPFFSTLTYLCLPDSCEFCDKEFFRLFFKEYRSHSAVPTLCGKLW